MLASAGAQQPPLAPTPSPFEQALSQKLSLEINEDLQDKAALMTERQKNSALEKQVADLQKQIDALKPKSDEKKP